MIKIEISEDYTPLPQFYPNRVNECINLIINDHKIFNGKINFVIVTDDFLRQLKKKYFNMDVLTDVMAFKLEEENEDLDGEIYISWDRIIDNSQSLKIAQHIEFKRIVIHGVLHLLGYDDQTEIEKSQMTKLEDEYIQKFSGKFYEC